MSEKVYCRDCELNNSKNILNICYVPKLKKEPFLKNDCHKVELKYEDYGKDGYKTWWVKNESNNCPDFRPNLWARIRKVFS